MKAIMISIKPKWVAKILNGEKTIEIRKTMPKCELPIDVYIYCTKEEKLFDDYPNVANGRFRHNKVYRGSNNISGYVVAKFTLNKVEEMRPFFHWCIEKKTCLTRDEVLDYLDSKDKFVGNPKRQGKVYAIHISNLEIFDRPRELRSFNKVGSKEKHEKALKYAMKEDCKIWERIHNGVARDNEIANCVELEEASYYMGAYGLTKAPQNFCYVEVE